jgi:hypothetical protein
MKGKLYFSTLWMCAAVNLYAQGVFVGSNISARTRVGSLDGPFAGTNIVGQMLGGASPSSLHPVGPIDYHNNGEFAVSPYITVPDVPPNQFAYVQLLAWDSIFWGSSLAGVPTDQLGRTDVVTVFLTTGVFPDTAYLPRFTQPAIVPPIPEPSVWALAVLAFGALRIRRFVTKAIK